jgi:hypothetical protein
VVVEVTNPGQRAIPPDAALIAFNDRNRNGAHDPPNEEIVGQRTLATQVAPGGRMSVPLALSIPANPWSICVAGYGGGDRAHGPTPAVGRCLSDEPTVLAERFDGRSLSAFVQVPNQVGQTARWIERSGYLEASGGGGVVASEVAARTLEIEVMLMFPDGASNDAGVVFGVQGAVGWQQLRVDGERMRIIAFVNGRLSTLASEPIRLTGRRWYRLKLRVRRDLVEGFLDGAPVIAKRGWFAVSGGFGLMQDGVRVRYDDFIVVPQP